MPSSLESIEEYLASVEEYFYWSISAVTHSLPDVHEVVNQLWIDISRYGPGLPAFPEVHIPALGDFQVPPPPPPPPPMPSSWVNRSADWAARHPYRVSGVVIGVVGAGLLVGYRRTLHGRRHASVHRTSSEDKERRQIVVVLGGDTPYGLPLIQELEAKGYIVIASVSTPEAADELESKCHGYVRAHVLDPYEPATVPVFLRSLSQTLSRKFPINAAGDPYASPSSMPYIQSIISLLTLPPPSPAVNAPLEHVSLTDSYLPYLNATQITPLHVVQALLPLLRTGSARSRDKGKKSIVICLPATDVRVGLPFASVQAMSAAGTLRAVEVLRREISIAALTDKSDSMKNIKVVVVDVGRFNIPGAGIANQKLQPEAIYKAMELWTASEKVTYGPAFAAVMHQRSEPQSTWQKFKSAFQDGYHYGFPRREADISVFTNNLVSVVSGGRLGTSFFGLGLGHLGRIQDCIRGNRFSVGAGARTYAFASYLPTVLLNGLLNLPHFLISIRNRLLPVQPHRRPPSDLPPPVTEVPKRLLRLEEDKEVRVDSPEIESASVSDADEESNVGDTVDSSWVSLTQKEPLSDSA